jgi:hypothetical protein
MELILQYALVAVIVAGCMVFSAWRLMSPRLRLRTKTIGQLVAGTCSACSSNKTAVHHPGARR